MANEIQLQINATLSNGLLSDSVQKTAQITQSTKDKFDHVFSVTTSEGALTLTVGTLGYAFITNLDSTNYVKYGPDSGGSMVVLGKLKATEMAAIRLYPGITLRMQADTATCLVRVQIWND